MTISREPQTTVTQILNRVNQGEQEAYRELISLVYEELRRKAWQIMSPAAAGQTLQPTALVHEAFAKLVGSGAERNWQTSRHFFNAAAEVMRQVLLDHAKAKRRQKRGGGVRHVDLQDIDVPLTCEDGANYDWEGLETALHQLKDRDTRRYQVVMLRFFAGLSDGEIASCLEVSEKTVQRDWKAARLFLMAEIDGADQRGPD